MVDRLSSEAQFEELLASLTSWAAEDPQAALDYATKYLKAEQHKERANAAIISAWAKKNPGATLKWLIAAGSPGSDQIETVLTEMGKAQPESAWPLAMTLAREQPGTGTIALQSVLRGTIFFGDFKRALRMVAGSDLPATSSPDGILPDKDSLSAFIIAEWASYQPEETLTWVRTLSDSPETHEQTFLALAQSLAAANPSAARDLTVGLPPGKIRQAMSAQTLLHWAMSDVLASRDWLKHFQPHPDFDEAAHNIAIAILRGESHLDVGIEWAKSISDREQSLDTLVEILSRWIEEDRTAAIEYLGNADNFSPEQRSQIRKRLPDES
jgi:hypothetical protein